MMGIVEAVGSRTLTLLVVALGLALSIAGCASAPVASHGTDGIANFAIYGD